MRREAATAFDKAQPYHRELAEIYKYFMPFRLPTLDRSVAGAGLGGDPRTNDLFDGTALSAAFSFAGNMQADWIPPHGNFFTLEPGSLVDENQAKMLRPILQDVARKVHGVLPRVHDTIHEMFIDLFAGTGALLVNPGSARYPVIGRAVPTVELAMEEGPQGDIWRRWWKRSWPAVQIESIWPDGRFSDALARLIKDSPSTLVEITQATVWDDASSRWSHVVWSDKCQPEDYIWSEDYITSPWCTPRFFKVPGESMGRGLAHLALPFVKTANKATELHLTAAAFATMGLWIRRNDNVFNPDTAEFAPGKIWTVQSTGGPLGPSIARLPVPQDFDLSHVVLADLRTEINKVLLNDELPDQQDPVRSATEIAGRLRRYARLKGGAGSRLSYELVTALVERVIEILGSKGYLPGLPNGLTLDQLVTKVTITAPAAAAQRADDVERVTNWVQLLGMLFGPQAPLVLAKVDELGPQMGRWLGVEEKYISGPAEIKQFKETMAAAMAQQSQAQQKPPTPADRQQALINGGAAGANGGVVQ